MIIESIARFIRRVGEIVVAEGRNGARIVVGTDRQSDVRSGYGDGDKPNPNAGAIDLVVGPVSGDMNFDQDKSRIYLSSMTDPDKYAGIAKGKEEVQAPGAIIISDHIRIRARKSIKISNGKVSILFNEDGSVDVESSDSCELKAKSFKVQCGSSRIEISETGGISLGSTTGLPGNILTDLDIPKLIVQVNTGTGTGIATLPVATNQNVKISG